MKGKGMLFWKSAQWFFVSSTIIVMFAFWMIKLPMAIAANAGDLDPSFGTNGVVTTLIGNLSGVARGVAIQPDGKIVVAGTVYGLSSDIFVARYNSNGSLDSQFGAGGWVITDIGGDDYSSAVAIQPDGKIVVAGTAHNGSSHDIFVARYNSNGSLDSQFGAGGWVKTDIPGGDEECSAIAIQPDGKIVVAGTVHYGSSSDIFVARYNSDGSLDTTFGPGGWVTTDLGEGDRGTAVAVQPDGKIVVAGSSLDNHIGGRDSFAVVRYGPDGLLDSSFGTEGKATTYIENPYSRNYCMAMALQPDGKIVVAGFLSEVFSTGNDVALARFNSDGTLDTRDTEHTGFGPDGHGWVTTHIYDYINGDHFTGGFAVAIQPNGKIVVTGYDAIYDAIERRFQIVIPVIRYNPDGNLDDEFGVGGIVTTQIDSGDADAYGWAVAIQSDGKIVVAGRKGVMEWGFISSEILLVRYLGASSNGGPTIADILNAFDQWVGNRSLAGSGPGNSAQGRLNALRNMIRSAGDLINQRRIAQACVQLQDAYNRCDGNPRPPDFASGSAAPNLANMIRALRTSLGCQ